MSTENPFVPEPALMTASSAGTTLRWWPAAGLLAVMAGMKLIMLVLEAPPFPVIMISFMGPAAVSGLIILWWLFASRASVKEKLIGLGGTVCAAAIAAMLLHFSMKGMSFVLYMLPTGSALFALSLVLLANRPTLRLPVALIAATFGFGIWALVQMHGVTGKFSPEFSFRWSPTAEQEYLKSLADQKSDAVAEPTAPNEIITRASAQWSDFRGPQRDGNLPGVTLNEDWKAAPPKLVWKSKIGPGWSSFTVAGNRLFTQEQRGDNEAIVCLNAGSGKTLWAHEYPSRFWESVAGAGPRATPTIGDDGLFALGANGNLLCLNPINGEVIWQRDIQVDGDCKPPQWGFSASPLVHKGIVIVHAGGAEKNGVLAYDAKTGRPRWTAASGNHSYCSAQLASFDGVEGILMSTNLGLQFLNTDDGTTIWNHEWPVENYRAIQPLVKGDSIYIGTSLGVGTRKITIKHDADAWKIDQDWTSLDMKPDFNDFVEFQGHIYGFDGNIFACVDCQTGKRQWKKGRYGNGQVLLLSDSGQLLITTEFGDIVLVKADPHKLIELGRVPGIEGKTWNHPVLIGNRLYVRNGEEVACYELAVIGNPAQESPAAGEQ